MKKIFVMSVVFIGLGISANAQNKWFETYTDSTLLTRDANEIIQQFALKIGQLNPDIKLNDIKAIKNTTPYLIFINNSVTVNLPFWEEMIPQQKEFFTEMGGGISEGKEIFGLFFNGFYLVHELGHSFFTNTGKEYDNAYDGEYDANIVGILYWKIAGEERNES